MALLEPFFYSHPEDAVTLEDAFDLRRWVRERLAQWLHVAPDDVALDRSIEDYGLDSIHAVELAGELEETIGREIDPSAFVQSPTLEGSIAALLRKLSE